MKKLGIIGCLVVCCSVRSMERLVMPQEGQQEKRERPVPCVDLPETDMKRMPLREDQLERYVAWRREVEPWLDQEAKKLEIFDRHCRNYFIDSARTMLKSMHEVAVHPDQGDVVVIAQGSQLMLFKNREYSLFELPKGQTVERCEFGSWRHSNYVLVHTTSGKIFAYLITEYHAVRDVALEVQQLY